MGDSQTDPNGHGTSWFQYLFFALPWHGAGFCYTNLAISGATTSNLQTIQLPQAQALYNAAYSQNIVIMYTGTNDSSGANMTAAETTVTAMVTSLHSYGYKVVELTAVPASDSPYWSGTNRTTWNQYLCGSTWSASGTPITCPSGTSGTSGADLVLDMGNIAAMQTPTDGTHYGSDHLHMTGTTQGAVVGGGKWNVAQFIEPLLMTWMGL
jgi:hypothetical protein